MKQEHEGSAFWNFFLNIGVQASDDEPQIRLYRKVNGLNAFFTLVAFSAIFIFIFFVKNSLVQALVQTGATAFYLVNLLLSSRRKLKAARFLTLAVFETQVLLILLLTNVGLSNVLALIILFPLLAALVEKSVVRHTIVSLCQLAVIMVLHYLFPGAEQAILNIANLDSASSEIIRIFAFAYTPVMAAVIIALITKEGNSAIRGRN
jgi:hypothetical protein